MQDVPSSLPLSPPLPPSLPHDVFTGDADVLASRLSDWRGRIHGRSWLLARPRSTLEVAALMRWASDTGTPVVTQGGNTGLSGAATPDESGRSIILSLERMNAIRFVDPVGNTVVAEAGCVLAHLQGTAAGAGRLFPVSLGSEGSCTVGGIVATNAGGINVVRYGMTRDLVLGLEYVTAAGEVVEGPRRLRKDNVGYDLRHLIVGSEGTLAVVTAAAFRLVARPRHRHSALCGLASPALALNLLHAVQERVGDGLIAFELMCAGEMDLIRLRFPDLRVPIEPASRWYVFLEAGSNEPGLSDDLTQALADALDRGLVDDAVMAQSGAQAEALWHLRFAVSEANRSAGPAVPFDISVATDDLPSLLHAIETELAARVPLVRVVFVGHAADGNMHVTALLNQVPPENREAATDAVRAIVYQAVTARHGSISAEHGIGRTGRRAFEVYAQPTERALMRRIKQAFDPAGILNPGVLF
ncbi:FAD-binding oxidoreductase [Microvirga pudoricolor]|uniref:FAD-binding oxidoreductase n=1 Tax=Microvirga pudoricolor TaxID=2778729 RepID=UPI0019521C46|nr:FAD-binding oxidoreductase [Microvirga pudoricolor]MBM6593658.1 FAD-binding oxidoreductase [Microvirga pudoricolor]